jgi:hypothetical protein
MIKNVVSYILHVRGAGKDFEEANVRALARLQDAAAAIERGVTPKDAGVDFRILDPGGGGGPCAPILRQADFDVSAGGLPEAQPRESRDND